MWKVPVPRSQRRLFGLKNPRETALMIQNIKSSQKWIQSVLLSGNVVYPWRTADIELNFETDQMPKGRFNENLTVEYMGPQRRNKGPSSYRSLATEVKSIYSRPNVFSSDKLIPARKIRKYWS